MMKFFPNVIKLLHGIFPSYGKTGSIMKKKPPGPHRQPERQKTLQERESKGQWFVALEGMLADTSENRDWVVSLYIWAMTWNSILYKLLLVVQKLQIRDYEQREDFFVRMQVILEQNKQKAVDIMSDMRHIFNLNMMVKKQNLPYSIPENPRKVLQKLYSLSALLFGTQFLLLQSHLFTFWICNSYSEYSTLLPYAAKFLAPSTVEISFKRCHSTLFYWVHASGLKYVPWASDLMFWGHLMGSHRSPDLSICKFCCGDI